MHLVVLHAAALSEAGAMALHNLSLPNLERLLPSLRPAPPLGSDETSLNLPHEQLIARLSGWTGDDGCLSMAAALAEADGVDVGDQPCGLLTPAHWLVGHEQIVLTDPEQLALDEHESRALCQAVRELFEGVGWRVAWGAPLRWYAQHPSLATLPTASLDRVIGRAIDAWLPARLPGAALRRLQSEVQMLLVDHPVTAAREARGALPVNSFWLSGTGQTQRGTLPADVVVERRLRAPCLADDWAAWAEAWQAIDATHIAELAARAARGEAASLSLCGERRAQRFDSVPRSAWQRLGDRWRRMPLANLLESL
jgi:hypothetical protein